MPIDVIELLRRTPLLGLLDTEALRIIANVSDPRRLVPEEVLFRQGERSDGAHVVTFGRIAALRDGQEAALLGPGSLIGRAALFVRLQRPATAVAREMSGVIRISPTLMKRVLQEFPASAARMSDHLADDLDGVMAGLDQVSDRLADPRQGPSAGTG